MRIKSKIVSILWKAVLLGFCTWGLLDGSGILAGNYTSEFPHMFTNIANLSAWVYFLIAMVVLIGKKKEDIGIPFAPTFKYNVTVSLLVTMLIGHFMLFDALFQDGHIVWHLIVLHYVVPLMTLFDWLLFDEKGRMPVWGPFAWLILVLTYLAFTMVAVGVFDIYMGGGTTSDVTRYPYTFLDPTISGVGGVAGFCAAMVVAFLILGYLLRALDKQMGKKSK